MNAYIHVNTFIARSVSKREYQLIRQNMKSFYTLAIVLASSMFLASCGGGGGSSPDQLPSSSVSEDGRMKALATVPGTWTGRAPSLNFGASPQNLRQYAVSSRIQASNIMAGKVVYGEIVVNLNLPTDLAAAKQFCVSNGCSIVYIGVSPLYDIVLSYPVERDWTFLRSQINILRQLPWVHNASWQNVGAINSTTYNDPAWGDSSKHWNLDSIRFKQARILFDSQSTTQVNVGIIDHNFLSSHQDLHFERADPSDGALDGEKDGTFANTLYWHGTSVAGIIGSLNNSLGTIGVAPDARLYAYDGGEFFADSAIQFALSRLLANSVRVINMSFGQINCNEAKKTCDKFPVGIGTDEGNTEVVAMLQKYFDIQAAAERQNKSILFIQSSGNSGDLDWGSPDPAGGKVSSEFNANLAGIGLARHYTPSQSLILERLAATSIIVGAYRVEPVSGAKLISEFTALPRFFGDGADLHRASFILAPGGNSTDQKIYAPSGPHADSYTAIFNATSAAAPHVSGVAAMIFQINEKLTASEVRDIILKTADNNRGTPYVDHPTAGDGYDGYRYLNAEAAVKEAIRRKNAENCGTVSAPFIAAQGAGASSYLVSAGEAATFTATAMPKPGYSFVRFDWKTSENATASSLFAPEANITFRNATPPPPAALATITVTPILADGTECREQAQSSSVNVLPAPMPTLGLVGHWSFDNCDARDSGPNALHGTKFGSPVCVPGKSGNAYRMNGTSDFFTVPTAPVMPTTAVTMSYWMNREGRVLGSFENYISKELSFQAYILPNGTSQFGVWLGVPGFWTGWGSPLTALPSLTDWVNYTFTYDNATRIANTYINGVVAQSVFEPDARAVVRASGHPMFIGRNGSANVYHIKGLIDEVRIYNRALTAEEVGLLAR